METRSSVCLPMNNSAKSAGQCRILSLDGGGAKGFYTLGVLKEIEAVTAAPLCESFDLIFGTSTGAIIAALLALGYKVDAIHTIYKDHVPSVMRRRMANGKSKALARLANEVFGDRRFSDVKTGIGIVATRWSFERPMILMIFRMRTLWSGFAEYDTTLVRGVASLRPTLTFSSIGSN
jgi:predicted acylesterase/phospholipase RssA